MRWVIKDIRVKANKKGTSYTTAPVWTAMEGVAPDATVSICNAARANFIIKDAPCTMVATGNVGTIIPLGAGGTIDAAATDMPWAHRLRSCLDTMLACDEGQRIVGIIDEPPAEHIYEALAALEENEHVMQTLYAHPNKMLLLTGPETVLYPNIQFETTCTTGQAGTVQHIQHVRWSNDIWTSFTANVEWGCVLYVDGGSERLMVALSRLLGSHRVCTPGPVVIPYPEGFTCPGEAMHLLKVSNNVESGSVRCSSTRGIAAQPTDFSEVAATVVLQDKTDSGEEAEEMTLLRQMLTSTRPADIGSACFQLEAMNLKCPVIRKATALVMRNQRANAWASISEPPPMLRRASAAAAHTICH